MQFEFATAGRIVFGNGTLSKLVELLPQLGSRSFVLTGSGSVPLEPLFEILNQAGAHIETYRICGEPDLATIQLTLERARAADCDFVLGYGGGSVIDSAKAIAALMNNPGSLMDYLEVIGRGQTIKNPPLPNAAIPTTAGTGSEVTQNAVIASPEHQVKVSMRSPMMIPNFAIIDPELTVSAPPGVTASTGMDALTQVIEAYISNRANPMTDIIAREGIRRGARSLLMAYKDGGDLNAREDMALCSLFGGLALANGGLGAVHGFAGPIGGMFDAPHGAICASLLPSVMKHNLKALEMEGSGGAIKARYQDIAILLTGNPRADVSEGVEWLKVLAQRLDISGLNKMGITPNDFDRIIAKAKVASSMQKNPVQLDDEVLAAILEEAF
jgi:alcohol dehydrogenase class IV